MNRNLNRRIHPIAEADGLSPKKLVSSISYVLSTPQSPLSARIATDGNRCPLIFV